ncbi:MAG: GNAT family N-acetyltransferase [Rhizobiaceae bacterium]
MSRILVPAFDAEPLCITGRHRKSGKLLLVLPLVRRRKHGVRIVEYADFGVTDYCAPVIHKNYADRLAASVGVAAQIRRLIGRHDILRFKAVRPEHAPFIHHLTGLEPINSGTFAHELPLNISFEDIRKTKYSPKHRQNVNAAKRRLSKLQGARIERISSGEEAASAIAELRRLRSGRFPGDPIADEAVCRFYQEIARLGAADGFGLTHRISNEQDPVAIGFGITHAGRYHGILIGCDYTRYSKCAPGIIMYEEILADWHEAGGSVLDFNVGDSSYKQRFGTEAVPIVNFDNANTLSGRIATQALAVRRRLNHVHPNLLSRRQAVPSRNTMRKSA